MLLKNKLLTFIGAALLANTVFANTCPELGDIKSEGLRVAEEIGFGIYVSYSLSAFNTDSSWGFFIAPIKAESEMNALDAGNGILSNLNVSGIPEQQGSHTLCTYDTGNPFAIAAAVQGVSPTEIKQFVRSRTVPN
jgi:hypothetical protein